MIDYKMLCEAVCGIVKQTGSFLLHEAAAFSPAHIEYKDTNNLVSYVDKAAEQNIIAALTPLLPDASFIAEESYKQRQATTYEWIIDPLDGTTNFMHGIPCYCVSIALLHHGKLVLGVIYEPNHDECFYTWSGAPTYLNGRIVQVSTAEKLSKSLIATGFPYTKFNRTDGYMKVFDHCMLHTHGLRRWGSACADLAYVACGRFEAFYEYGLAPWDVAAGIILVQNAGGKVYDFAGADNFLFGEEIIASNLLISEEFLSVVKACFAK